jgi:hypothetical protein
MSIEEAWYRYGNFIDRRLGFLPLRLRLVLLVGIDYPLAARKVRFVGLRHAATLALSFLTPPLPA